MKRSIFFSWICKDLNATPERFSGQLWPQNWAREEEEVMDFTKTSDRRYQLYNHSYDDALKNIAAAAAAIGWWVLPMGFVIKILRLRRFQLSFDSDQLRTVLYNYRHTIFLAGSEKHDINWFSSTLPHNLRLI